MRQCKVCGDDTEVLFNIKFDATPICESCAQTIFIQQAHWYTEHKTLEDLGYSFEVGV